MIDIHRLRIFRSVVAAGSISAASQSLGYTKSAISQQLSALSRETGIQLFVRTGRGLTLTGPGKSLFEKSDSLLREHATLETFVDELKAGRRSPLVVGTFASAGEALLPQVISRLTRKYPDSPVNVVLTDTAPPVTRPDIDIRVEIPGQEQSPRCGFTRIDIAMEPYVAILPQGHPLSEREEIRLDELKSEKWIRDDVAESPCSTIAKSAWQSAGFTPTTVIQAADHHSAIAFVRAGLGVCIMPRLASRFASESIHIVDVVAPTPRRRIVVLVHESVAQSSITKSLVDHIAAELTQKKATAPVPKR